MRFSFGGIHVHTILVVPSDSANSGRQDIKWLLLKKENACKNPLKRTTQDIIQFLVLPISFNDLLLCKKTGEAIKNPVSL